MWKFDFPWMFLLLPLPILVWWLVPAYRTTASAVRMPFFHEMARRGGRAALRPAASVCAATGCSV
jgi:Ca-activated chloride channel family protein